MNKRKIVFINLYIASILLILLGTILYFFVEFENKDFTCNLVVSIGVCIVTGCLVANLVSNAEEKDRKMSHILDVTSHTTRIVCTVMKLTYSLMKNTDKTFDSESNVDLFGERFYKYCDDFSAISRLLTKKQRFDTGIYLNKSGKNLKIVLNEYADYIKKSKYHPVILQVIEQLDELIKKTNINPKIILLKDIMQKLEKIDTISNLFDKPIIYTSELMSSFIDENALC